MKMISLCNQRKEMQPLDPRTYNTPGMLLTLFMNSSVLTLGNFHQFDMYKSFLVSASASTNTKVVTSFHSDSR